MHEGADPLAHRATHSDRVVGAALGAWRDGRMTTAREREGRIAAADYPKTCYLIHGAARPGDVLRLEAGLPADGRWVDGLCPDRQHQGPLERLPPTRRLTPPPHAPVSSGDASRRGRTGHSDATRAAVATTTSGVRARGPTRSRTHGAAWPWSRVAHYRRVDQRGGRGADAPPSEAASPGGAAQSRARGRGKPGPAQSLALARDLRPKRPVARGRPGSCRTGEATPIRR